MLVRERVDSAQVTSSEAPPRGFAERRALDEVRMGYGACTVSGCGCTAYMEGYDSTTLCANCKHDYSFHS